MPAPTPHLIAQARRVSEMIEVEGLTYADIAEALGVSRPRISQIVRVIPELSEFLGTPDHLARFRTHRKELWRLRTEAMHLIQTIRNELAELDARIADEEIERALGHR